MNGVKKIIILICIININLCFSTILSRNTFERYEGLSWPLPEWNSQIGGSGEIDMKREDEENTYETQAHGGRSLWLKDPDNTSYANVYKSFSNSSTEYMIEFYLWIYNTHATIDSFPLCVLWNIPALGLPEKTDVSLFLHESGDSFLVYLEDSAGIQPDVATIGSTDRWYKIQIYRYVSGGDTVVTFYLDGDSINTYVPMNKDKVSNKISLGTTQADSLADGEVFYDDVIISTPPTGEHPRLLFDSVYVENILRPRRNDYETNPLGTSYGEIWDSLEALAEAYCTNDYISYPWPDEDGKDTLHYSFHQLGPHSGENNPEYWLSPFRQIKIWLTRLAFVGLIDDSTKYVNRAKGILNSLANWQSFVDHSAKIWPNVRYALLGTGEIAYGIALAYDWLYNDLNNYEKLNIQNTLINLAVNQLYLQALYYDEPGPPNYPLSYANGRAQMFGGMGLSCLVLDSVGLDSMLYTAQIKIDSIVCKCTLDVCNDGAYNEGASYAPYTVRNITVFLEAEDSLEYYVNTKSSFLRNYPRWRIHTMLPGAEQIAIDSGNSGPQWDIPFCDYDKWGGVWHPGACKIASILSDSTYQWFQKQRRYMKWKELLFFLWMDKDLDTLPPNNYPLMKIYNNIGWATVRTGWSANDYLLAFKCGRSEPKSHFQAEPNNFVFGGKGKWLIADIGYARQYDWRKIHYQNAMAINEATHPFWDFYNRHGTMSYDSSDNYVYFKNTDTSYTELQNKEWTRSMVFIPKMLSFAISDYGIKQGTINTLNWYLHSYVSPEIDSTKKQITLQYSGGPKLQCYIVEPDSIIAVDTTMIDTSLYFNSNGSKCLLREIKVRLPIPDTIRVVAGFSSYDTEVDISEIEAKNFNGVFMENDSGACAVFFGKNDSTRGGKYDISVTDSLLNVVCDLVPDTNYLVITKRDTLTEDVDTLPANDVGILSFKLNGSGNWKVIITLARTTGSIEINQDNTYCNMPFIELDLEMTDPLDSNSVDSMRIWQDYTVNDTLYTDSTGWIPFDSTYFWYLRQGEGINIVYAQFMGNGWNESIEYCDTIVFDKTLPTGSFVINDDSTFANNSDVTLKNSLAAADTADAKMRFGHKYLKNIVKNSGFDTTTHWQTDTALYHDSLELYEIPLQTIGNYFYQAIVFCSSTCGRNWLKFSRHS